MKFLHLPEEYVTYEMPFAKGLQYQAAIISMEGADFTYMATHDEMMENMDMLTNILNKPIDEEELFDA